MPDVGDESDILVASQARRQNLEVNLKKCTPEEKILFDVAITKEIGNWKK